MRWLVWSVVGLLAGCGGGNGGGVSGAGGGIPKCIPGDSKACAGLGACVGYQVCAADGTYGACMCGSAGAAGGGAGGAGGVGGSGGGGRGGTPDAGSPDTSSTCPTDPDAADVVFGSAAEQLATVVCDWYQQCRSAPTSDHANCVTSGRRGWVTRWAEQCRTGSPTPCPYGFDEFVEARFRGVCLDLALYIPCTAMHDIGTYVTQSCDLSTICAVLPSERDAGGQ